MTTQRRNHGPVQDVHVRNVCKSMQISVIREVEVEVGDCGHDAGHVDVEMLKVFKDTNDCRSVYVCLEVSLCMSFFLNDTGVRI